jgi:excisionase family DNA binding protein
VTEELDQSADSWLTLPEAAAALGVSPAKVRQMVRDHELAMARQEGAREPRIPAAFIVGGAVVKGLAGTLTLLADHGLTDEESIDWLFSPEESLPGRPIDALRENRGREVRRRAQVVI